jgi:hypothetical protein
MGIEIFDDLPGQRIKALMINYHQIVTLTRQACVDVLEAEADVLCFRQVMGEAIPMEFISGVIHASRIMSSDNSIMGKGWIVEEE